MLIGRSFSHHTLDLLQCKWITGTFYSSGNMMLLFWKHCLERRHDLCSRSILKCSSYMWFKFFPVNRNTAVIVVDNNIIKGL